MASAEEARLAVRNKYREIIGRNHYSQDRRNCCFTPCSDGLYYSDCSSSVSYSYKEAGYGFGILNTVGMWESEKLTDVPVVIKSGQIMNPEALRIGDMLLYAGKDSARARWGYVGHVEMVGEIAGSAVTLYGHGSGLAKAHEMTAYNRYRFQEKSSTPVGNTGLIRVRRYIRDDGETVNGLRRGDTGAEVERLQAALMALGYELPQYGADGDFGPETERALAAFQRDRDLAASGVATEDTLAALYGEPGGAKEKDGDSAQPRALVRITAGAANLRLGNGTQFSQAAAATRDSAFPWVATAENGWFAVDCGSRVLWVSGKMAAKEEG